jgi:hypothetical protein
LARFIFLNIESERRRAARTVQVVVWISSAGSN